MESYAALVRVGPIDLRSHTVDGLWFDIRFDCERQVIWADRILFRRRCGRLGNFDCRAGGDYGWSTGDFSRCRETMNGCRRRGNRVTRSKKQEEQRADFDKKAKMFLGYLDGYEKFHGIHFISPFQGHNVDPELFVPMAAGFRISCYTLP